MSAMKQLCGAAMVAVALWSCGEPPGGGSDAGTDAGTDPDLVCDANPTAVTTAQVQTQVLDVLCKECHAPGLSGISYGDYSTAALTQTEVGKASIYGGDLKIVDPGNLANSTLWLKCAPTTGSAGKKGPKGQATGTRMPNDGDTISADQRKALRDWICSGANP